MKLQRSAPQAEKIKTMFSKVANHYDLANSVLSMGVHHLWRNKVVEYSEVKKGQSVLDCATGTGDLAVAFKKAVSSNSNKEEPSSQGQVLGTDFCSEMLVLAKTKAEKKSLDISFEWADVMNLKYPDKKFDVVSISFGIRNVENPSLALKEMARVTKPGGKVMVLEFGQVNLPLIAPLYRFYSNRILPIIGGFVTGQTEAYQYLQTSSAEFPCRENFIQLMKDTLCFEKMEFIHLSGGIAFIYKGTRLSNSE